MPQWHDWNCNGAAAACHGGATHGTYRHGRTKTLPPCGRVTVGGAAAACCGEPTMVVTAVVGRRSPPNHQDTFVVGQRSPAAHHDTQMVGSLPAAGPPRSRTLVGRRRPPAYHPVHKLAKLGGGSQLCCRKRMRVGSNTGKPPSTWQLSGARRARELATSGEDSNILGKLGRSPGLTSKKVAPQGNANNLASHIPGHRCQPGNC